MDKQNVISTTAAVSAGYGTYRFGGKYLNKFLKKTCQKVLKFKYTPEEQKEMHKISLDLWEKEGFKKYGVQIVDVSTPEGLRTFETYFEEHKTKYLDSLSKTKNPIKRLFKNYYKKRYMKNFNNSKRAILKGKNAFYNQSPGYPSKKIYINMQNGAHMFAHELGHAKNFKSLNSLGQKIIYSFLRNYKFIKWSLLGMLVIVLATDKDSKKTKEQVKQEKSYNPLHNVGQFIKNNCGKLASLVMLPTLIEETMASYHGQKMGLKYFGSKNMKALTKSHFYSFASYFSQLVVAGSTMYLANKTRDFTKDTLQELLK